MSVYPGTFGPIDWEDATPEEAGTVGLVVGRVQHWEQGIGKQFRERCNRFFRQYREFESWREQGATGNPRDRDVRVAEAREKWGAHLFIPQAFRVIEQIVPRMVANAPKLLVLPRDEEYADNAETMRLLVDAQQSKCNIDLPFQAVARAGLMYGLGVGKCYWRHDVQMRRKLEPHIFNAGQWVRGDQKPVVTYDDPFFEDVDVFDFMWDPYGFDLESCDWVVHRSWLSIRKILDRVQSGAWNTGSAQKLDPEAIRDLHANPAHYSEIWEQRNLASGLDLKAESAPGEMPHEVLEFHDGERVCTVLDRQVLVRDIDNVVGEMPFQIYRPTPLSKMMVGIGMLEPIEGLGRELNTLRSQRRDAATVAIKPGYIFDENAVDAEQLEFAPDAAIGARNVASLKDVLMPIPRQEVPASGYEEEAPILRDIESISGLDAQLSQPGGAQAGTATEASLAQASLSARVSLLSRRYEEEIVRPVSRLFVAYNQQMITEARPAQPIPGQEHPSGPGDWQFFKVDPGTLEGEMEVEPEGGSMEAKNIPQERNDAMLMLQNVAHDFYADPTKARLEAWRKLGIKHPKALLRSQEPNVPMAVLRILLAGRVDPALLMHAVVRAREIEAPQEGAPAANQVAEQVPIGGSQ